MGELSKKIGEYGEKVTLDFFKTVGWKVLNDGITIECVSPDDHNKSEERGTHGLDLGFIYKSPLVEGELVDIFISVKYSDKEYPDAPRGIFKPYFIDLANSLECYKKSNVRSDFISGFDYYNEINTVGVLVWLNNSPSEKDEKLLEEIAKTKFNEDLNFDKILVFSNSSCYFINNSMNAIKLRIGGNKLEFYYPSTGKNLNPNERKYSGDIMPVEFLTSNILVFKEIINDRESNLYVCSKDNFNESDFKRLVSLSLEISQGWASKILIGFPDYNELRHRTVVNTSLLSSNQSYEKSNVEPFTYLG
ncbi:GapS4a family protein [Aquimarina muelleri]|uniref:GapS4a family protein n=1 Tax=Aquimarina muelleri TaxID=279356 RepID=UPI003F686C34